METMNIALKIAAMTRKSQHNISTTVLYIIKTGMSSGIYNKKYIFLRITGTKSLAANKKIVFMMFPGTILSGRYVTELFYVVKT